MVAMEHLHADALLFVLAGAALALLALRATFSICQRARLARDLAIIAPSGRTGRPATSRPPPAS